MSDVTRPPAHHALVLREARERELAILAELTEGNPLEHDEEAA